MNVYKENSSNEIENEFWFIPVDILMIVCTSFVVVVSFGFLLITILDKNNRTISMILLWNSLISELIFACVMCSMAIFTLENDLKQIEYKDCLCVFRGYLSYSISAVRSHSYLLQSIYRYMIIIYPTNSCFQSKQFHICLIISTWFISLIHPIPFVLTNQIEYNAANQVCHMSFEKSSWYIFYTCFIAYLNPITIIGVIYYKLVEYVRRMNKLVTPMNQYLRIQREFIMVRRIVMLLIVLITLSLPYTIFFFMSFFTTPPTFYFRWPFLSVDISLGCIIMALLQFSDSIQIFLNEILPKWRSTLRNIY